MAKQTTGMELAHPSHTGGIATSLQSESQSNRSQEDRSRLLRLPAELHVKIYEFAFSDIRTVSIVVHNTVFIWNAASIRHTRPLSILLTRKEVCMEASAVLYDTIQVQVHVSSMYEALPEALYARHLGQSRDFGILLRARHITLTCGNCMDVGRYSEDVSLVCKMLNRASLKSLRIKLSGFGCQTSGDRVWKALSTLKCEGHFTIAFEALLKRNSGEEILKALLQATHGYVDPQSSRRDSKLGESSC